MKKNFLEKHLLLILTLIGIAFGIGLGFALRHAHLTQHSIALISFPGDMLMRMLKMLILPLFVSSIISGISKLDPKSSGKVGVVTLVHIFISTFLAAIVGVMVVVIVQPGKLGSVKIDLNENNNSKSGLTSIDTLLDLLRNIFPENLFQATMQQGKSQYTYVPRETSNGTVYDKIWHFKYENNTNMLGMITFSIAFGMVISRMGEKVNIMLQFFEALNQISMSLIELVMWYAPVGILFLIAGQILIVDDMKSTAISLGYYILTVLLGLLIHTIVSIPFLYFVVTRKNPFKYYVSLFQAILTAFATASSTATMPTVFKCLENDLGLERRIVRSVIPVGITLNMNGTAVYQTVAAIFIAQLKGYSLSTVEYLIISLTATASAIGAVGLPTTIVITIVIVLESVGIPLNGISLIFSVDFFVDRFVTVTNLLGNSVAAGVVNHFCKSSHGEKESKSDQIESEKLITNFRL